MQDLISYILIVIRILIVIPLIEFLIKQRSFGQDNGMIWRMRRIVLLFISSLVILLLNLIIIRVEILLGIDTNNITNGVVQLISNFLVLASVTFAVKEIDSLNKH
jgi:hypothetical protein